MVRGGSGFLIHTGHMSSSSPGRFCHSQYPSRKFDGIDPLQTHSYIDKTIAYFGYWWFEEVQLGWTNLDWFQAPAQGVKSQCIMDSLHARPQDFFTIDDTWLSQLIWTPFRNVPGGTKFSINCWYKINGLPLTIKFPPWAYEEEALQVWPIECLTKGRWLTDSIISASLRALKKDHPEVGGL